MALWAFAWQLVQLAATADGSGEDGMGSTWKALGSACVTDVDAALSLPKVLTEECLALLSLFRSASKALHSCLTKSLSAGAVFANSSGLDVGNLSATVVDIEKRTEGRRLSQVRPWKVRKETHELFR